MAGYIKKLQEQTDLCDDTQQNGLLDDVWLGPVACECVDLCLFVFSAFEMLAKSAK